MKTLQELFPDFNGTAVVEQNIPVGRDLGAESKIPVLETYLNVDLGTVEDYLTKLRTAVEEYFYSIRVDAVYCGAFPAQNEVIVYVYSAYHKEMYARGYYKINFEFDGEILNVLQATPVAIKAYLEDLTTKSASTVEEAQKQNWNTVFEVGKRNSTKDGNVLTKAVKSLLLLASEVDEGNVEDKTADKIVAKAIEACKNAAKSKAPKKEAA